MAVRHGPKTTTKTGPTQVGYGCIHPTQSTATAPSQPFGLNLTVRFSPITWAWITLNAGTSVPGSVGGRLPGPLTCPPCFSCALVLQGADNSLGTKDALGPGGACADA